MLDAQSNVENGEDAMTRRKSFYSTAEVAAWYEALPNRKRSIIINEIIAAHIHAARPSPVVVALNEIRDALAGMTVLAAATPAPTAEEENSAAAEKLSQMF